MELLDISAADGTTVPLTWFEAEPARCALLLLPALGIQSRLYNRLGEQLAGRGCSVCLMEQRGHGRSPLTPGRGTRYCLGDILDHDMPAAMAWVSNQSHGMPLLLGGHSLGGHLSTIYTGQHPGQLTGVVHLACAFPYYGDYSGRQSKLVRLLCSLVPLFALVPGYYPGHIMGFGGRESAQLMRQWCEWARTGSFDFGGRKGLAEAVSNYEGPLISVSFSRDDFASEAALERAMSPFTNARVTRVRLGEGEQGEHLGHTGWTRGPEGVVCTIMDWMDAESIGV
jgi:predicted alpha/beta hydrolase